MKRIKFFIEASPIAEERLSGVGHALLELIRALEQHPNCGKTFEIYLTIAFDKRAMLDRWKFQTVKYRCIPFPLRPLNLLWKFDLLPPMDIILGRGVYLFPNYKNWRLLFSKSITYVHDISFVLYPEFVTPKNQSFLARNMPRFLKRTTMIAADSYSAQKEIIQYCKIPEKKVIVLHHGINTAEYYPRSKREVDAVKKKHGITGEYIFYLGNIEPRKNLVRLLAAYRQLSAELRDKYSLVMIGGLGWLNEPILQAINQARQDGLNLIKPEHFVPDEDIPALHSGATLLAHPAIYEGFGFSPLQAMACGTPVMAGNNSSMIEVVGDAGVLVAAEDTGAISDTIERLLSDKKLRGILSEKGLQQARKFNWQTTVGRLVKLVEKQL